MALTLEEIADHPALHRCIRVQAQAMNQTYEMNPRLASVFATQQRWLMAHIGLALHFRREPDDYRKELTTARFLDAIRQNSVASRNTADAFVKEMLHYGFIEYVPTAQDGRIRPLRPATASLEPVTLWLMAHLQTLDSLDGANRLAVFLARPDALAMLQPRIADGLLSSNPVREPKQTFSLFTWLNNGGVVMDWLISGVDPGHAGLDRIPTGVVSIGDFAKWLKLSRTHLARKLRAAEDLGSVGWLGQRGQSVMWVSRDFYGEYMAAQAVKLAIMDAAFTETFGATAGR
ncbi:MULTISPECIES: hypothetical protein [Mesorhizobium]|uniref:Uncharacterized protein n=1 Tax=Rhizobium loti TaxID=381 RepID=A0A6M7U2C0_RHILI|nr:MULTISPECIES: hypothetical protein [Mesorhizobium]KRB19256.1 hypothetical protein ASE05_26035 [Mesorhizobium sp. Root172]OBQ58427.1 hypothetical protein A8145_26850 [Mesorhizobium loti]QKC69607.1 hypothetical protein EB815_10935 [Mesorhizobium loti]